MNAHPVAQTRAACKGVGLCKVVFAAIFSVAISCSGSVGRAAVTGNQATDCTNSNAGCSDGETCCPTGSGGGSGSSGTGEGGGPSGSGSCLTGNCSPASVGSGYAAGKNGATDFPTGTQNLGFSYETSKVDEVDAGKMLAEIRRVDMAVDAAGPGGFPMAPSRTYNNWTLANSNNLNGKTSLGPRWHFNYDMAIEARTGAPDRLLRTSSGGQFILHRDSVNHNLWLGDAGNGAAVKLVYAGGVYTLTQPNPDIVYTFNYAGALTKMRGQNGHLLTLTRDSNNTLTRLDLNHETPSLDTDTRYMTFHYDTFTTFTWPVSGSSQKRLTKITAWDGSWLQYGYDTHGMLQTLVNSKGELLEFVGNESGTQWWENTVPLLKHMIANNGTKKFDGADLSSYYYHRTFVYNEGNSLLEVIGEGGKTLSYLEFGGTISDYTSTLVRGDGTRVVQKSNHSRDPVETQVSECVGSNCSGGGTVYSQRKQTFLPGTRLNEVGVPNSGMRDSQLPKYKISDSGTTTTYEYLHETSATASSWDKLHVMAEVEPDGTRMEYERDANYRITAIKRPLGRNTYMGYDGAGNMVWTRDPMGNTWYYRYDALGRLIETEDSTSGTTKNAYNTSGQITVTTNTEGRATTYTYDNGGKQIAMCVLGTTTTFEYDFYDRLTTTTEHLGNKSVTGYDAVGNIISSTDAMGNKTRSVYDAKNNLLLNTIAADDSWTTYSYDNNDRLTTFTDQRGMKTLYGYDAMGRKISETNPLGQSTTYNYGSGSGCGSCGGGTSSHVTSVTDPANRTTYYDYHPVSGRKIKTRFSGTSAEVVYTYDGAGRVTQVEDGRLPSAEFGSQSFTYDYDKNDRMTSETYPDGAVVAWRHDALGRRRTITDPENNVTTYTYANMATNKQLDSIAHNLFGTENYSYNSNGLLYEINGPESGGVRTGQTIQYGLAHRVSGLQYFDGSDNRVHEEYYTYDTLNRKTQTSEAMFYESTIDKRFAYNQRGALAQEQHFNLFPNTLSRSWTYQTDAAGNRTRADHYNGSTTETIQYAYNAWNQLTSSTASGGTTTYQYDLNGNRTTETLGAALRVTEYDRWGRLVKFSTGPGTSETQYIYLANGNLLQRTAADGSRQRYYYDGLNPVAIRSKAAGTSSFWKIQEVAMLRETPVAADIMRRTYNHVGGATYTTDHSMHWNLNGHLTHETDQERVLSNYYEIDAFGTVAGNQGTPGAQNTFRYTSKRYDPASGLYNYGARWLKPGDPTWQAEEPLGLDGPNMYQYGFQDPVNFVDPDGLFLAAIPFVPVIIGGGVKITIGGTATKVVIAGGAAVAVAAGADAVSRSVAKPKAIPAPIPCPPPKKCPPCVPPAGTVYYNYHRVPPHIHHGNLPGSHYHIYTMNQNPINCKCSWSKTTQTEPPPPGSQKFPTSD